MCPWIVTLGQLWTVLVIASGTNSGRYDGYKVVRVLPQTSDDVDTLAQLHGQGGDQMEIWNEDDLIRRNDGTDDDAYPPLEMHVAPQMYPELSQLLDNRGLETNVLSEDFQRDLDDYILSLRSQPTTDYFNTYHPYDEILTYVEDLAVECGSRCSLIDIGSSYEGRPLRVLKVTGALGGQKQGVWIDAGIHAREWISHATNQYLMTQLIRGYDNDEEVRMMTDTYDWYFLPCVNPDGYAYSWTKDRLWRKTRSPKHGSACYGTDANRNFDFHWGTIGVSFDPCSNTYPGEFPFSEPETRALAQFILQRNATWEMFITLHSKGQFILAPWGYTDAKPVDYPKLSAVGEAMQKAIFNTHGKYYTYGTSAEVLYKSSGTSRDWAKGAAAVPYVYTLELRDRGQYGWLLPAEQIIPTGEEVWAGLKAAFLAMQPS